MKFFHAVIVFFLMQSGAVEAKVLKSSSHAIPPYVIKAETTTGFEYEIVRDVLAMQGIQMEHQAVPFARVFLRLEKGRVDLGFPVQKVGNMKHLFFSEPHIKYVNIAVTHPDSGIAINSIKDLGKYELQSFQGASQFLGPEYLAATKKSPKYKEIAKLEIGIGLIQVKRNEVLVLDSAIYRHMLNTMPKLQNKVALKVWEVFPHVEYSVGFRDKSIRDNFDKNLKTYVASGKYQKVIDSYLK